MAIVSEIETYFADTGKIKPYADKVANNSDVVSIQIPVNGVQRIYLQQNSLLDSRKIRAIQVIADDEQFYGFTPTGTTIENLPVAALPTFQFTLAKDINEIAVCPFTSLHRPTQFGKFFFIDSEIDAHRLGDSFIEQVAAGNYTGIIITLKFWYD
jgi:hypothetical protein